MLGPAETEQEEDRAALARSVAQRVCTANAERTSPGAGLVSEQVFLFVGRDAATTEAVAARIRGYHCNCKRPSHTRVHYSARGPSMFSERPGAVFGMDNVESSDDEDAPRAHEPGAFDPALGSDGEEFFASSWYACIDGLEHCAAHADYLVRLVEQRQAVRRPTVLVGCGDGSACMEDAEPFRSLVCRVANVAVL